MSCSNLVTVVTGPRSYFTYSMYIRAMKGAAGQAGV